MREISAVKKQENAANNAWFPTNVRSPHLPFWGARAGKRSMALHRGARPRSECRRDVEAEPGSAVDDVRLRGALHLRQASVLFNDRPTKIILCAAGLSEQVMYNIFHFGAVGAPVEKTR